MPPRPKRTTPLPPDTRPCPHPHAQNPSSPALAANSPHLPRQKYPPQPHPGPSPHPQSATGGIATEPPPHTSPPPNQNPPAPSATQSPGQSDPSAYSPHTHETHPPANPYSRCPYEPPFAHPTPPARSQQS